MRSRQRLAKLEIGYLINILEVLIIMDVNI